MLVIPVCPVVPGSRPAQPTRLEAPVVHLVVDPSASIPPYEQITRDILDQVRTGVLVSGDRLPAIRALAGQLQLAAGTVARAYRELEEGAVIVTRRGAGTTIADDAAAAAERVVASRPTAPADRIDPELLELISGAVTAARTRGHGDAQILGAVRQALGTAESP